MESLESEGRVMTTAEFDRAIDGSGGEKMDELASAHLGLTRKEGEGDGSLLAAVQSQY